MKNGKTPTKKQSMYIASFRLNPANWLVSRDNQTEMVLIHRMTDRVRTLPARK